MRSRSSLSAGVALALIFCSGQALAQANDVKDGVEAWSEGDYAAAVELWQEPAAAGEADALFNMAQAYRLGRGVPADPARARALYARAAEQGHLRAADIYGLMLFQDGEKAQAIPYIEDAAKRGDPRAQYLLGIALFNGDEVKQDWVRSYALLTLANSQGLPQAPRAIAQMDKHIPMKQRSEAVERAQRMRLEADALRASRLAAADLAMQAGDEAPAIAQAGANKAASTPSSATPTPTSAPAQVAANTAPPILRTKQALRDARMADGTSDPEMAGATYTLPVRAPTPTQTRPQRQASAPKPAAPSPAAPVQVASRPVVQKAPERSAAQTAAQRAGQAAASQPRPSSSTSPWRVQLGAFGVDGNAERLWAKLASRPELRGRQRLLIPAGRVTKLQAGGFASKAQAEQACAALKASGQDCLVTRK
ncbi:SPOR domain-containing protein [Altericroceibacterium endophyticum]|uniref:Sporulation protein n=1 Tax=Altericroceibacterium endophyticum TaxID=1808508 RepID=A0A6I4T9Y1_9SPHN|nr:SPOR domain-containing protein [Altericroceibacterium endophyticum]MXO66575.1 sporulation protein [Altericroceibacterium endophyticum]